MSIAIDISIQFTWAIANTEAFLAGDRRIRPVHFLLGILKVIDPAFMKQVGELDVPEEHRQRLAKTGANARHYLEMSPDDITVFRRKLRRKTRAGSPRRNQRGPLPVLHRSSESRALFGALASRAAASRQREVSAVTLLEELVRSRTIDLEALWQEVVKGKVASAGPKPHKWSTGREWQVVDDDQALSDLKADLPPVFDGHGRNLTQLAKVDHLCPVIGRKREIAAVTRCLHRASKRSVLLVGPPGVGKTSIVEALAQKLCRPNAPERLREGVMIQIAAGELVLALASGGRNVDAVRERLVALGSIEGLILAIEDIDRLLTPEPRYEAVAELIRNALARSELTCIGTTTDRRYEAMRGKHDSFTQSFNELSIAEMSNHDCLPVAKQWAVAIARFHGVEFTDDTIKRAIEIASGSIPGCVLPATAIDLLENAAVYCKVAVMSSDPKAPQVNPPAVTAEVLREVVREQYGVDGSEP